HACCVRAEQGAGLLRSASRAADRHAATAAERPDARVTRHPDRRIRQDSRDHRRRAGSGLGRDQAAEAGARQRRRTGQRAAAQVRNGLPHRRAAGGACAQRAQDEEIGREAITGFSYTPASPGAKTGYPQLRGDSMRIKLLTAAPAASSLFATSVQAQTEIQWWHSMQGALGEALNGLADKFNASQKDYKVVTTYKGQYPESLTAAIAAFRAGNAPHLLQ